MDLSELQKLPMDVRLNWLRTEGLAQLQQWLTEGLKLRKVAQMLGINEHTLYRWRAYPEIAEIFVRAGYKEIKPPKPDLTRPIAYRIICGLTYTNRGKILFEYTTAQELWDSDFIKNYFKSYNRPRGDYFDNCLDDINRTGVCHLSNTFAVVHGTVNRRGYLKYKLNK